MQHVQPFLDRQVGANHQRPAREARVARRRCAIAERPRDEHGHHHGLASASRHLAGVAGNGQAPWFEWQVGQLRMLRDLRHPFVGPRVLPFAQRVEILGVQARLGSRSLAGAQDLLQIDDRLHGF